MLRGRTVIPGFLPPGGIDQDLQQDPGRSGCEARRHVRDDDAKAAGVVRDSKPRRPTMGWSPVRCRRC